MVKKLIRSLSWKTSTCRLILSIAYQKFCHVSATTYELNTYFPPLQTLQLLQQQRCLFSRQLASLHQLFVQVHHSVSLKISCVMEKETAWMDSMKTTVWSSVEIQVSLSQVTATSNDLVLGKQLKAWSRWESVFTVCLKLCHKENTLLVNALWSNLKD